MSITSEEFRASLGRFASGVTVITTKDSNAHLHGLTVSAFCSVSMNPPLILICIQKTTGSHHAFEQAKCFVVNILEESQQDVSNHFASHLDDKFTGQNYHLSEHGLPILDNCLVNLECNLKNSYDGGDHTIFVGEIENAKFSDGKPLTYFHGKYHKIND
ncbi:MAG: flavin reductase family protein [Pyrinomonadaceae bacterium]|nr:flavin reductase family protein [Pyrinomonadaceae bacterium]